MHSLSSSRSRSKPHRRARRSNRTGILARWISTAWLVTVIAFPGSAFGEALISTNKPFAEHFMVLQLSDSDPAKHALTLSVAYNLLEHYGPDMIDIAIVAFGPGIELVYANSKNVEKVNSLAAQGVRFVGCMNTIKTIIRETGEKPALNPRMILVQTGVAGIIELVDKGYTLVRP